MTHRETKKESKRMDSKSNKPEIVHEDEMKKHSTKGVKKGNRE